jgi:rhodanese-related sulfurtransferase
VSETAEVREVDPAEASRLAAQGALLLDVREQSEWDAGHAAGAVHLPLTEIEARAAQLPRDRLIVAVCRSGARSLRVAQYLGALGHDVVNLAGGSKAWVAAGLPFVTDAGEPGVVA